MKVNGTPYVYLHATENRVILENPLVSQPVKELFTFCGPRNFITTFQIICNWPLCWTRCTLEFILILSPHFHLGFRSGLFSWVLPTKKLCAFLYSLPLPALVFSLWWYLALSANYGTPKYVICSTLSFFICRNLSVCMCVCLKSFAVKEAVRFTVGISTKCFIMTGNCNECAVVKISDSVF
jgi:hypothetical protein